jgi:prepilin peptidase CpaA
LAVLLLISVVTDLRTQKIYNWVTFPGILAGIILNGIFSGGHGILFAFEGIAVGMAWIILILLRGSGFGDLKLIYTVGAFMGPAFTAWTLLYTAISGGVLGIIYALRRRVLGHTVKNALLGAHVFAAVQSPEGLQGMVEQSKAGKMAYAPAIALGVLIEWLLTHHAG